MLSLRKNYLVEKSAENCVRRLCLSADFLSDKVDQNVLLIASSTDTQKIYNILNINKYKEKIKIKMVK